MSTQADNVHSALGKSLDGRGVPEPPSGVTSDSHTMKNVAPSDIRRNDFFKWSGRWRLVSSVIGQSTGATFVYFRDTLEHAVIVEGTGGVTVYRPRDTDTYI